MEFGRYSLRRDPIAQRIAHAIDLDHIISLLRRPRCELTDLGWSAVPPLAGIDGDFWATTRTRETHIHLGGTLPPLYFWVVSMGCESSPIAIKRLVGESDGCADWLTWRDTLYRAARDRLRMAHALGLLVRPGAPAPDGCADWLREYPPAPLTCRREVLQASTDFRLSHGIRHRRFADPLRDVALANVTDCHYAAGERRFLMSASDELRRWSAQRRRGETPKLAIPFARCLLRYLRVRNAFYQLLTHGEGSSGLTRFVANYGRRGVVGQRKARVSNTRSAGASMTREQQIIARARASRRRRYRRLFHAHERLRIADAAAAHLVSPYDANAVVSRRAGREVSFRVSPERGSLMVLAFHAWLTGWMEHLERERWPEHAMGLIVHLIKKRPKSTTVAQLRRQSVGLMNLLQSTDATWPFVETLRRFVVGIDAAGHERLTQPRIFAPAFDDVRERYDCWRQTSWARVSLGYTYHVGEDCWDVLNGLRHVDETRCLLLRHKRGRFGHALILAEPPSRFYRRQTGLPELTRCRHVLDLVWAIKRLDLQRGPEARVIVKYLVELLRRRCEEVAPPDEEVATPTMINSCWDGMRLHERDPDAESIKQEPQLAALLGIRGRHELEELVTIEVNEAWLDACVALQRWLRSECALQGVTIESNPTSNVLVGGYADWSELPYDALVDDALAVSINSDDPGIFFTTLPNEYERMFDVQRQRLGSTLRAEDWIADRRRDARRSSFLRGVPTGLEAQRILSKIKWNA